MSARAGVDDLPDLVDLLSLATSAGLALPNALDEVTRWAPAALRPGLVQACAEMRAGMSAEAAVGRLVDHRDTTSWGDAARPLVHALGDHLVHGTPLSPSLHRVADDVRARRRRAAQTRARRLPILLLFPLVTCTLPAFGLLTVAPIVASTLRSLDGEPLEAVASDPNPTEVSPCSAPSCPSTSTSTP